MSQSGLLSADSRQSCDKKIIFQSEPDALIIIRRESQPSMQIFRVSSKPGGHAKALIE